ncbi:cysteine hydrolase [Lysobacter sp. K5869]|uniref:cysteine hydrolase family protein n=1 Tax=Lysobacter sp. K5869 TaxID=2820808 RepID=UPI001C06141B|nr:cysteine hydrolase family protein [Lysobacter sp. K5869]QWP77705.1 cysteine hydrolase [Lysobacter sp. K5869]
MTAALLVIDVQRGLFDTQPPPAEAAATIARTNALAERARAAGAPVVLIQHEGQRGFLTHASDDWQLDPRLRTAAGDQRVRKTTPDSFLGTDLQSRLQGLGVDRLVIAGYASEFCVDTTVRRAAALGYPVTIAADAHTTHDKPHADAARIREHHNATLSDLTSFGPPIRAEPAEAIDFAR